MRSGRAEKEYSFGAISWQAYSSEGRADLPVGMHADGAEHYLQVTGAGAKSWVYRYSLRGKARKMGAGSLPRWDSLTHGSRPANAARFAKGELTRYRRATHGARELRSTRPNAGTASNS